MTIANVSNQLGRRHMTPIRVEPQRSAFRNFVWCVQKTGVFWSNVALVGQDFQICSREGVTGFKLQDFFWKFFIGFLIFFQERPKTLQKMQFLYI